MLLKGLEEEVYGGTTAGDPAPLSALVTERLPEFHCEPDARNIEFTTDPCRTYRELGTRMCRQRTLLRSTLEEMGDYTLIPGASMSLGDSSVFFRSTPDNPYHAYIEETYHTDVVTASTHINVGVEDEETLIRALRVVRMEASVFLALTAGSPFLDNAPTGYHSIRWHLFPKTPKRVPLFTSHEHYRTWVGEMINTGQMQNSRHLWHGVRPNGPNVPHDINRLELRICDRIGDLHELLAIVALLEARIRQVMEDPSIDPLTVDWLSDAERQDALLAIEDANESAVAEKSLSAVLRRWEDGSEIKAREWARELISGAEQTLDAYQFDISLDALYRVLEKGNTAERWLSDYAGGMTIREIIQQGMRCMRVRESAFGCDEVEDEDNAAYIAD
jgi:predicted glutamate--cysteine ligase